MFDQEYIPEHIADYLADKLPPEDKLQFEKQMKSDASLHAEVQKWLGITYAGYELGRENLKQELLQRYDPKRARKGNTNWLSYAPYAVAAVLAILLALWLWPTQKADPQTLFAAYFEVIPAVEVKDTDTTHLTLKQANLAFNQQNYPEAVVAYEQLLTDKPDSGPSFFFHLDRLIWN